MKLSKVFSVIMIALMLVASTSNIALAKTTKPGTDIGGVTIGPTDTTAASKIGELGNKIIGIVQTAGTIIAVVVIVILGIKYMMGSAEEKAEYKKTLMPYIIGAVLVLLSVNIVSWIFSAANGLFN